MTGGGLGAAGSGGTPPGVCALASDLSVHYLTHEPRFPLTPIDYDPPGYNPRLSAAAEAQRKWPEPGEIVTYTAHVANQGRARVPSVGYRFSVDGVETSRGALPPLGPGDSAEPEMPWVFQDGPHVVRFELTSDECPVFDDGHVFNNAREQYTNAVLFTIYTSPLFEGWMGAHLNAVGTRSGADWIQFEADEMNRLFESSRSELAPEGVRLRIGIDRIVRLDGQVFPTEPCPTDSCWTFSGEAPVLLEWLEGVDGQRDPVTMHEWGHQIGLLDVYQMDVPDFEVFITEGPAEATTFSNSSAGDRIERLFDGSLVGTIATYEPRPVWFAIEFKTPRRLDRMRLGFDGYWHRWQVVSSDTLESAVARTSPAVVRTPPLLTGGMTFGEVRFPAAEAKVWVVHVERLDGDRATHVDEWELFDGETQLDVPALSRSARVAGTESMPIVSADIVHFNSTFPNDLMGGGIPYELSPYHQWALNLYTTWEGRDVPLRRGWFGQYIALIPENNSLLIHRSGVPLAGARVEVFQQQDGVVPDLVKYTGTTDAEGRFDFPKQTTAEYAASYGLSAPLDTPSPFSTVFSRDPNVVGLNGVLVLRITDQNGARAYRFMDAIQFNLEYAHGNVEHAFYSVDVAAEAR